MDERERERNFRDLKDSWDGQICQKNSKYGKNAIFKTAPFKNYFVIGKLQKIK